MIQNPSFKRLRHEILARNISCFSSVIEILAFLADVNFCRIFHRNKRSSSYFLRKSESIQYPQELIWLEVYKKASFIVLNLILQKCILYLKIFKNYLEVMLILFLLTQPHPCVLDIFKEAQSALNNKIFVSFM